jgi:hypothetical protein
LVYEGIESILNKSIELDKQYNEKSHSDPNVKSPGVIVLFRTFLKNIPNLSNLQIENETKRIKEHCGYADIFDDLIKAVIKSNIILLTYNVSGKSCKLVTEKIHNKIESKNLIHKCYVEVARVIYDNVELFIKKNDKLIYQFINDGIVKAIRNILPLKQILQEYLNEDYVDMTNATNEKISIKPKYEDIKSRIEKSKIDDSVIIKPIENKDTIDKIEEPRIKIDEEIIKSLTQEENKIGNDIKKIENSMHELNTLIYDRKNISEVENNNGNDIVNGNINISTKKNLFEEIDEN